MAWCCQAPSHYLNLCRANSLKHVCITRPQCVNTLRPRQNGHHFTDDTFKRIFVNENVGVLIEISLKFVPKGPINNIPALVQIMAWVTAWRRPGDKPLSEPMMVCLPTHICVTRPQWVKCCILPDGTVYQLQLRWWVGDIWDKLDNPLRQIILAELYNVFLHHKGKVSWLILHWSFFYWTLSHSFWECFGTKRNSGISELLALAGCSDWWMALKTTQSP